jgi:glycolate oxidase
MNDTPSADLPPVAMARAARQAAVVASLSKLLPRHAILSRPEDTVPYECDRLTAYRTVPLVVVLPETEAQGTAVLKTCHGLGVPIVHIALCRLTSAASSTCRAVRLCQ